MKKINVYINSYLEYMNSILLTSRYNEITEPYIGYGLMTKEENEYTLSVHNKTSYDVGYYIENCSVNDWSYESENYLFDVYDAPIHGESYFVYEFEVYDSFMEDNKIESIEKMEFNLMMEDDYYENISDIWEANSDKITIE